MANMAPLKYVRILAGDDGESQLEQHEVEMRTMMFAPPASPLDVADPVAVSSFSLLRLAADWQGEWHASPSRQWLFFLSGAVEMEVSDGQVHSASAGSIVLLEDTTGRGHHTRVLGREPVVIVAVQLPLP